MSIGNNERSCLTGPSVRRARRNESGHYLLAVVFASCSFTGCVPLSENQQFERDNRFNIAKEEFLLKKQSCRQAGGAMRMRTSPLSNPGRLDYESARCVRL
ncbi:MAG: hypothetical protein KJO31_09995 [Gammaproteobacteria bacterium]|nr:hypothetical protein [Gammaproteobacteria bacterium]